VSRRALAICRSTLTNPTNGCVPMNVFGEGSLGAASIAWVTGAAEGLRTRQDIDFNQDVWSIDGQYSPFSTWAGPVSIAAGFEYRKESFDSTADSYSLQSLWNVGNYKGGSQRLQRQGSLRRNPCPAAEGHRSRQEPGVQRRDRAGRTIRPAARSPLGRRA
jgi:hypothetical protein